MAIVIPGKTKCTICNAVINEGDTAIGTVRMLLNEADPAFKFNDTAMHSQCVATNTDAQAAIRRIDKAQMHSLANERCCVVCGQTISKNDSYIYFSELCAPETSSLSRFNYLHLHDACLSNWSDREEFYRSLKKEVQSGILKGTGLQTLLKLCES